MRIPTGGSRMTSAMPARSAAPAKRVLVVEDELMIRMLLEDMLGELGYTVAAEAGHVDEALEATKTAEFDLAILDVNLDGQPISPVVEALIARGTPFVFATGYGERGLPEPYRDRPMLKKPFQIEGLKQMLESALEREACWRARLSPAVVSSSAQPVPAKAGSGRSSRR